MQWTQDLQTAPKKIPEGKSLLAILPGFDFPEAVRWCDYEEDIARNLGEVGYWDYASENMSEITGGIAPSEVAATLWALIDLPERKR